VSASEKLLAAMRRNPCDWDLGHLKTLARQRGLSWRHRGGSHCVFVQQNGRTLSVPANRPIKPICIRMFLALIEASDP
jgi:hypothetical protein